MKRCIISRMRYRSPEKVKAKEHGFYAYDLRHGDGCVSDNSDITVEIAVLVNHFGTLITDFPVKELEKYPDWISLDDFYKVYKPGEIKPDELKQLNIEL